MSDVGRNIAAAVQGHIRALRLLGRESTTCASIGDALGLPESVVDQVMREFRITGAKCLPGVKSAKVVGPFSQKIELKR